jgi:hypothetical protein
MIELARCIERTGGNVVWLKEWVLREDVFRGLASGQQCEHINHPDTRSTNARAPAGLFRVNRDSGKEF